MREHKNCPKCGNAPVEYYGVCAECFEGINPAVDYPSDMPRLNTDTDPDAPYHPPSWLLYAALLGVFLGCLIWAWLVVRRG